MAEQKKYVSKDAEIREGQANNIAFSIAVSEGRGLDFAYVAKLSFAVEEFLKMKRQVPRETFEKAVNDPKFFEWLSSCPLKD